MRAGSEADDKETRERIAKAGNGAAPIGLIAISAAFDPADFFAMLDETGAKRQATTSALRTERLQGGMDGVLILCSIVCARYQEEN